MHTNRTPDELWWLRIISVKPTKISYTPVHMSDSNGNGWIVLRGASGNGARASRPLAAEGVPPRHPEALHG
jgi:hypothetical protein